MIGSPVQKPFATPVEEKAKSEPKPTINKPNGRKTTKRGKNYVDVQDDGRFNQ